MKLFIVLVFLVVLFPLSAGAQVQFGAGLKFGALGYNEDELDSSRVFWGGHARIRATRYFTGEVSLQHRQDEFLFGDGEIRLDTWPLQVSGIVYPLAMIPVSPYFLAGTGWYFLEATVSGNLDLPFVGGIGTISHTENAFHIGVGVEVFVGDHFSTGVDVRKAFLEFDTPLIHYEVDAYFVNAGATFYF
jgi:opacity protein-like surface antigen